MRTGTLSTTGSSTNYIRSIELNQNQANPDYWIKKGAAIICNLDD